MGKMFDVSKLQIEKVGEFADEWTMAKVPTSGTVLVFDAVDRNVARDNSWVFYVQVPEEQSKAENIIVRPEAAPGREELTTIERRAITFMPASIGATRGKWYCKISLGDPLGERTKIGVRFDEREMLPAWFSPFRKRMKKKDAVKATNGTDAGALTILVDRDDYPTMIEVFFASRVWPLLTGFRVKR